VTHGDLHDRIADVLWERVGVHTADELAAALAPLVQHERERAVQAVLGVADFLASAQDRGGWPHGKRRAKVDASHYAADLIRAAVEGATGERAVAQAADCTCDAFARTADRHRASCPVAQMWVRNGCQPVTLKAAP
jgi:hypothetical protein